MATRKPALSTQLKNALKKIEELESSLSHEKRMREFDIQNKNAAREELEQVHRFLDAVPGVVARKTGEGYDAKENSAMTRIAAWLAAKGGQA